MELVTRSFWVRLQRLANEPDTGARSLWDRLRDKLDLARYRPESAPGIVVSELAGRDGPYYILKNPSVKSYYRLSARDHFLWERMDGNRSVKDLVVAYFAHYGTFAFGRIAQQVSSLKAGHFLTDKPIGVYRRAQAQVQHRRLRHKLLRVADGFMQHQFAIGGLDRLFGGLYRWGGFLLFTRLLRILYVLLSVLGIACFARAYRAGSHSLVATSSGSYVPGLVVLLTLLILSILIHELSHALTVKHYGREVREAGPMIYFGFPGFFVDTTDIWMEGKRARLAVSWAGPYSGLILAGAASICIALWPDFALNGTLFRFAFMTYLLVFVNLNPLLKLDGYYLLMDWLEIPMLREKSLAFLRAGLPARLRQRGKGSGGSSTALRWFRGLGGLSREERILTLFGVLSALWTLYAVYLGISFWQSRLAAAVGDLFAAQGSILDHLLAAFVILLSAAFLMLMLSYPLRLLVGALRGAKQRGLFASTWRLAAVLLGVVAVLTFVLFYLPGPVAGAAVGLAAVLASVLLAARNTAGYAGSRFAAVSAWLGLAVLAWLVASVLSLVTQGSFSLPPGSLAVAGFDLLAGLSLCAAAAALLVAAGFRPLWTGAWVFVMLVLFAGGGSVLLLGMDLSPPTQAGELARAGQILFAALGLVWLLPSLLAYVRTASGPAWVVLALAFGWLIVAAWWGLSPAPAYLLLACTLVLHNAALSQVRFRGERRMVAIDLDDGHRLRRAFAWTMEGTLGQVAEIAGERRARRVAASFTGFAGASRWPVGLVADEGAPVRVTDGIPESMGLVERGEVYAAALSLLLDLVVRTLGTRLMLRTLQGAYDALPWEEREIAGQYLYLHVDQARALSKEFEAIHRDYAALVSRVPLFATMDAREVELLLARLQLERHPAGKRIIRQGDRGDRFYIVRQGHVEVTQRDAVGVPRVVNQLDRGAYFGEVALLHDAPRNATCRATVPTETLALSREDFDGLVRSRFAIRGKLDRMLARAELLRRLPLFSELDGLQIQEVAAQLQEEHVAAGTILIRQGEVGETFYLIERGRVQVFVTESGRELVVAERGPGEYVGEIALLLEVPRTASARALTPVELLTLSRKDFDRLVQTELYVSRTLERETSRRMSDLARLAEAYA